VVETKRPHEPKIELCLCFWRACRDRAAVRA
jgi:hypothetical protein